MRAFPAFDAQNVPICIACAGSDDIRRVDQIGGYLRGPLSERADRSR